MLCAGAGYAAGKDLCSFRCVLIELCNILVINAFAFIYAKLANLLRGFLAPGLLYAIVVFLLS
jgi:hypothetical protein